jgi:hypothetical protein
MTVQVERGKNGDHMLLPVEEEDGSKRYGRISVPLPLEE